MISGVLDYKKSTVYLREEFIPFGQANLSIASSPILYGLSIYTVFNVVWDEEKNRLIIFRLKDHYQRLVRSAKIMDFNLFALEWPYEKFAATMTELLRLNNIKENALVRVTVFIDELIAGTKIHGLKNSLSAYIYPKGQILPKNGVSLCVSSWIRNLDNSIPSRAKVNGGYINSALMKNEALLNGCDDAVAIDEHGHVAESTVANIFLVRDNKLITPGRSTDILEGITRDTVIKLAYVLGIEVVERGIDRSELYICDEAFLCGSSADIAPVISIDKRVIGEGKAGKLTKQILRTYATTLSGNDHFNKNWCTIVAGN
jgi:branched-chain amino acid aminotransferase